MQTDTSQAGRTPCSQSSKDKLCFTLRFFTTLREGLAGKWSGTKQEGISYKKAKFAAVGEICYFLTYTRLKKQEQNNPPPPPHPPHPPPKKTEEERRGAGGYIHMVPGEVKRREVELDPQISPEEIMSREVELQKLDFLRFGWFLNSSATDIVLVTLPSTTVKQQLRCALVAAQWRRDTALTLPLFWRRSTVSPVFFGRYPRSSLHSLPLFSPCPRP